jgi:UDP-2-acetamido-2,6-beta-L-arabino-hexul-4-ose reductase
MNVLVTGSNGFIGMNLVAWLTRLPDMLVLGYDQENTHAELRALLGQADIIFHLAGVNRPQTEAEFTTSNVVLTRLICQELSASGRPVPLVLASSIQATLDNPYGISKRQAEEAVTRYAETSNARVAIYRLKNVFGKWCRPNYNSVVATFCYNLTHDLPITISDPNRELELVHVDDVVRTLCSQIEDQRAEIRYQDVVPSYRVTLGRLADLIRSFREMRRSLLVPDLADEFTRKLYGTYLSYLESDNFAYDLLQRCDARGCLAEFVKAAGFGQIFISRTLPGITRGNHYHHAKSEKFLVLEGEAVIRFRSIRPQKGDQSSGVRGSQPDVIEYRVSGRDFRVVDIPPGYAHSIENVGQTELVTLFWASEVFDAARPDTNLMAEKQS